MSGWSQLPHCQATPARSHRLIGLSHPPYAPPVATSHQERGLRTSTLGVYAHVHTPYGSNGVPMKHHWAFCCRSVLGTLVLSPELLQQCLGLLQVGRVKALGEPAIDRCQEFMGFRALALLLPQAAQTHGGAQLQRFGLLAIGARHSGGDRLPLPTSIPHSVARGCLLAASSCATACPARTRGRREKWTPRRTAWP